MRILSYSISFNGLDILFFLLGLLFSKTLLLLCLLEYKHFYFVMLLLVFLFESFSKFYYIFNSLSIGLLELWLIDWDFERVLFETKEFYKVFYFGIIILYSDSYSFIQLFTFLLVLHALFEFYIESILVLLVLCCGIFAENDGWWYLFTLF